MCVSSILRLCNVMIKINAHAHIVINRKPSTFGLIPARGVWADLGDNWCNFAN